MPEGRKVVPTGGSRAGGVRAWEAPASWRCPNLWDRGAAGQGDCFRPGLLKQAVRGWGRGKARPWDGASRPSHGLPRRLGGAGDF